MGTDFLRKASARSLSALFLTGMALSLAACGADEPIAAPVETVGDNNPSTPPKTPTPKTPDSKESGTQKLDCSNLECATSLEWSAPLTVGNYNNSFMLSIRNYEGASGRVELEDVVPFMDVHDHGTDMRRQQIEVLSPADDSAAVDSLLAQYRVSGILFTMSGPWVVRLKIRVGDTRETVAIPVEVP